MAFGNEVFAYGILYVLVFGTRHALLVGVTVRTDEHVSWNCDWIKHQPIRDKRCSFSGAFKCTGATDFACYIVYISYSRSILGTLRYWKSVFDACRRHALAQSNVPNATSCCIDWRNILSFLFLWSNFPPEFKYTRSSHTKYSSKASLLERFSSWFQILIRSDMFSIFSVKLIGWRIWTYSLIGEQKRTDAVHNSTCMKILYPNFDRASRN